MAGKNFRARRCETTFMAISGDYSQPVNVNGFSCKNCTDVDYAKKHIDPAHPKDGPYGVTADTAGKVDRSPSVLFGGSLGGPSVTPAGRAAPLDPAVGGRVNLSV